MDEVKAHLRIFHCDDDDMLSQYVARATAMLDGYTGRLGRCLISQDWEESSPAFCTCDEVDEACLRFRLAPVQEVLSLTYWDGEAYVDVDPDEFVLSEDLIGPRLDPVEPTWPVAAPRRDAVIFQYTAGYGDPEDVPPDLRSAVMELTGHFYENRESTTRDRLLITPQSAEEVMQRYRRFT